MTSTTIRLEESKIVILKERISHDKSYVDKLIKTYLENHLKAIDEGLIVHSTVYFGESKFELCTTPFKNTIIMNGRYRFYKVDSNGRKITNFNDVKKGLQRSLDITNILEGGTHVFHKDYRNPYNSKIIRMERQIVEKTAIVHLSFSDYSHDMILKIVNINPCSLLRKIIETELTLNNVNAMS